MCIHTYVACADAWDLSLVPWTCAGEFARKQPWNMEPQTCAGKKSNVVSVKVLVQPLLGSLATSMDIGQFQLTSTEKNLKQLYHSLRSRQTDCKILHDCYTLDTNHVPEAYVLISRSKFQGDWWESMDKIKDLFNQAADVIPRRRKRQV